MPINIDILGPIQDKVPAGPDSIAGLVGFIFTTVISLSGAIMLIMLLFGGVTYLTAGGNDENTAKAKKIMLNAIIGLIIVLASYGIGTWILAVVSGGSISGGGGGGSGDGGNSNSVSVTPKVISKNGNVPVHNAVVVIVGATPPGGLMTKTDGTTEPFSVPKGNHEVRGSAIGYRKCKSTENFVSGSFTIELEPGSSNQTPSAC